MVAGVMPDCVFANLESAKCALVAAVVFNLMWWLKLSLVSSQTPNHLTTEEGSIQEPVGRVTEAAGVSSVFLLVVKWMSSDLGPSKVRAFWPDQVKRVLAIFSSCLLFEDLHLPETTIATSSMYQGQLMEGYLHSSSSNNGLRYKRNRMGDMGEPWGIPVCIGCNSSLSPSNAKAVVL